MAIATRKDRSSEKNGSQRAIQSPAKGFIINGMSGPIEIPPGAFYFNTKARINSMIQIELSPEARRVYDCLELATMGFQQEAAVIKDPRTGEIRHLRPRDLSEWTGYSRQRVRRALVELEEAGVSERRSTEPNGGLYKGKVEIVSWAIPRAPKVQNGSQRATQFPDWLPESWAPLKVLAARLRLKDEIDWERARDYLPEGEEAARAYMNGLEVATRFLESICAEDRLYKEERTERTEEKEPVVVGSPEVVEPYQNGTHATTTSLPEPLMQEPEPETENLSHEEPGPVGAPRDPQLAYVAGQLGIDRGAARHLIERTRAVQPDATVQEIVEAVLWKLEQVHGQIKSGKIANWVGFMLTAIPQMAQSTEIWINIRTRAQYRPPPPFGD